MLRQGKTRSSSLRGLRGTNVPPCYTLSSHGVELQAIRRIIFVDVADVLDGFLTQAFGSDDFDVVEPLVRVQATMLRLLPNFGDAAGSGVVARESEKRAVLLVEISI